jgi:hypothetical protein
MKSACRVPITLSSFEALTAPRGVPVAVPLDHHQSHLPSQFGAAARGCRGAYHLMQIAGARYVSPRASTAQAMRAVLLAIATVTTRAGLRSSSERTQTPVADVLEPALRMTEVAPITRSLRR